MAKIDWKLNDTVMPVDANSVGTEIETAKSNLTTQQSQINSQGSRISTIEDNYVNKSGTKPAGINSIPPSAVQPLPTSKITDLKKFIVDTIYPINSIVQLASTDDPNVLFGGTWVKFAEGRTIVGVSSTDTDFGINNTGGNKTTNILKSQMPSHNHTASSAAAGSHQHSLVGGTANWLGLSGWISAVATQSSSAALSSGGSFTANLGGTSRGYATSSASSGSDSFSLDVSHSHALSGSTVAGGSHAHDITVDNEGSGSSLSLMQPYIAVGIWKRTA